MNNDLVGLLASLIPVPQVRCCGYLQGSHCCGDFCEPACCLWWIWSQLLYNRTSY